MENDKQGAPDVGQHLIRGILAAIEALIEHPELGRVVPEFNQPFFHELIRPPFRIIYWRDSERARVVRVWRSERLREVPGEG